MSEFDKEAEREKLRKQLERDKERRETTQQMSELLLKGATMLNVHCADCASPIFRHDGDEFCPTCNRSVEELQTAGESPDAESTKPPEPSADPDPEPATPDRPEPEPPEPSQPDPGRPAGGVPGTNAEEALSAAIARLADRAATADDPRQATEFIEAAHTASEALALLGGRQ